MTGLSLYCLERHPSFPQSREARMTQLMAGELRDAGALARATHDLVQSSGSERSTTMCSLQNDENAFSWCGWTLLIQIAGQ